VRVAPTANPTPTLSALRTPQVSELEQQGVNPNYLSEMRRLDMKKVQMQ
jgi:hypothetical protein